MQICHLLCDGGLVKLGLSAKIRSAWWAVWEMHTGAAVLVILGKAGRGCSPVVLVGMAGALEVQTHWRCKRLLGVEGGDSLQRYVHFLQGMNCRQAAQQTSTIRPMPCCG